MDASDAWRNAGRIDIALNAIGMATSGLAIRELSLQDFGPSPPTRGRISSPRRPSRDTWPSAGSGVILTLSTPGSRMAGLGFLGYGVTCAGDRDLLAHPRGRASARAASASSACRSHAIPKPLATSHAARCSAALRSAPASSIEEMLPARQHAGTLLKRFPTLAEVARLRRVRRLGPRRRHDRRRSPTSPAAHWSIEALAREIAASPPAA